MRCLSDDERFGKYRITKRPIEDNSVDIGHIDERFPFIEKAHYTTSNLEQLGGTISAFNGFSEGIVNITKAIRAIENTSNLIETKEILSNLKATRSEIISNKLFMLREKKSDIAIMKNV